MLSGEGRAFCAGLDVMSFAQLAAGDTSGATGWLAENVQRHGGLYAPRDLIERACGGAVSEAPLLDYLEAKFGAIYGL